VEEHDSDVANCTPEGMTRFRTLCERALAAAGLHYSEGSRVWTAYRDFEDAILPTLEDATEEVRFVSPRKRNRSFATFGGLMCAVG
jgi:hypothetical protein